VRLSRLGLIFKWIPRIRQGVEVHVVTYHIPNEDGLFYIERKINDRPVKFLVAPREIRRRMKYLRFRFYELLKTYGIKTEIGWIIEEDKLPEFKKALSKWLNEWEEVKKAISHFIVTPHDFNDWPEIAENIKTFKLPWPPKNWLSYLNKLSVEIIPIKLPRHKYHELIEKAILGG